MPSGSKDRLKIGGMALENGVIFQTERHWAMAVRLADGGIEVASGEKSPSRILTRARRLPILRGMVSLAEGVRVLPAAVAHGGELPLFSGSPLVVASLAASVFGTILVRNPKKRMPPLLEEVAASALALLPTLVAMRQTRAIQYHAAEHKSINAYELTGVADESHARDADAEHPRCGSNIIGPVMVLMTLGNAIARRALGRRSNVARLGVGVLSLSGSVELIQWAARRPGSLPSRLLIGPGEELQHFLTTAEPTGQQLEVGLAALNELLRLEDAA